MPLTPWTLRTLPLLLALAASPLAAEQGQTQWKLATFTWVKRAPAEPGAPPNAHPAALTPAAVAAALAPVQTPVDGEAAPLFAKDELASLARALSEALAQAQPGEDLVLLSTNKRGGLFMDPARGVTARLFVREGALNLIVHDTRSDFMDRWAGDRTVPEFVYGSRRTASAARLQAPGATRLRGDWLALPLAPAPAAAPVLAPAPVPLAAPAAPRDAAFYEAQTQRLKALKKLREENLLTEAEYQEKRDAILKTL